MNGFSLLYGNEPLKNFITRPGAAPHAVLLEGRGGSGKTTAAILSSCAMVCESEDKPCLGCASCKKVLEKNAADIKYISVDSGKKYISVDTIRQVRNAAIISPVEFDTEVFIISHAEKMNTAAQNAFLKILEEPPAHARFILLAENTSSLLPTVISRCTLFRMQQVGTADFENFTGWYHSILKDFSKSMISKVLGISSPKLGSIENSIDSSEKRSGTVSEIFSSLLVTKNQKSELCEKFLSAFSENDYSSLLSLKKNMPKKREDYAEFLSSLSLSLRDIISLKASQNDLIYYSSPDECRHLVKSLKYGSLLRLQGAVEEAVRECAANGNVSLSETKLLINAYHAKNR